MSRPTPWIASAACLLSISLGTAVLAQKPPPKPPVKSKTAPAPPKVAPATAPLPPATDLEVHTTYTRGAETSTNTTYVQGPRQRVEFPGVTTLDQCDLHRTVLLNSTSRKYLTQPYPEAPPAIAAVPPTDADAPASAETAGRGGPPPSAKGGVVTYAATLTDTLERKPLFGREARRIRTVIVKQASPSACDKTAMMVEVDGWYVDVPQAASSCALRPPKPEVAPAPAPGACVDHVESQTLGDAKLGFPVAMVTTTTTGEGSKQEINSTSMEVTGLEITRLDASLFTVPRDFTEAKSSAELLPTLAAGGSVGETLFGSTADGTSSAAPKQPGRIRIGVLEPANRTPHTIGMRQIREHLVGEFRTAPFEALALAGQSAADAQVDAARLGCDYILFTEVTDIKTSKPGKVAGLLKRTAGEDPTRDIHEVKLDYKLHTVGGAAEPAAAGSTKASSGGGIGVSTALRLAAVAGRLYLSMYGMGGMGSGLLSSLMSMPGLGGAARGFAASGLFDPRMAAMSSMRQMVTAGALGGIGAMGGAGSPDDDSEATLRQTVNAALGTAAKSAMAQLQSRKK